MGLKIMDDKKYLKTKNLGFLDYETEDGIRHVKILNEVENNRYVDILNHNIYAINNDSGKKRLINPEIIDFYNKTKLTYKSAEFLKPDGSCPYKEYNTYTRSIANFRLANLVKKLDMGFVKKFKHTWFLGELVTAKIDEDKLKHILSIINHDLSLNPETTTEIDELQK